MNTDKHRYFVRQHLCLSVFVSPTSKPLHGLAALVGARHALRNPDSRICGFISVDLRRKRLRINPKRLK
jgi:hypothetical protein